jgi:type I restriction enzyme S subunit
VIDDIKFKIYGTKEHLTDLGFKNSSTKLWKKGSIILSTGASIGHVGIAQTEMCTKQGIIGIEPTNKLNNEFLARFFEHNKDLLNRIAQGSTIKEIRIPLLEKIKLLTPPIQEQENIASILSKTDEQIQLTEEIIAKTEELKKGLMQQLLTKGIGHTEFKESELGMIPKEWDVKQISEIGNVKGGKRLPKGEDLVDADTGFPYIRVKDFKNNSVDFSNIKYVPEDIQEKIKRYIISSEDVYISVAGTIGVVGTIPEDLDGANLTENANKICELKMNKHYLVYSLESNIVKKQLENFIGQGAQPKLALFRIEKTKLFLPSNEEQNKITYILLSVDKQIKNNQIELNRLTELKKGLMQDLLSGKVRVKV